MVSVPIKFRRCPVVVPAVIRRHPRMRLAVLLLLPVAAQGDAPCLNSYCSGIVVPQAQRDIAESAVQWAVAIGPGPGNDEANGVAVDAAGSSYVVGSFKGTAAFGSESLTAVGQQDAFVTKVSASGSTLWAVHVLCGGYSSIAYGEGVAIDPSTNVFITGRFKGDITIGSTALSSGVSFEIFLAKLTSAGVVEWAVSLSGDTDANSFTVAVDATGAPCITGYFEGMLSPGGSVPPLTSAGGRDAFVAKFSSTGSPLWAARAGGPEDDSGRGIDVDADGDVLVTGAFAGASRFDDQGGATATTITSAGETDIYVAKYTSDGEVVWAVRAGGPMGDEGRDVAVDASGDVYVTGHFENVVDFAGAHALTSTGGKDAFIAKFTSGGGVEWSIGHGGDDRASAMCEFLPDCRPADAGRTGQQLCDRVDYCSADFQAASSTSAVLSHDEGTSAAVHSDGTVFVTGKFEGVTNIGEHRLVTHGRADIFVAHVDAAGDVTWAIAVGSDSLASRDDGNAIAIGSSGHLSVVGRHWDIAEFGSHVVRSENRDYEAYLMRVRTPGTPESDDGGGISAPGNDVSPPPPSPPPASGRPTANPSDGDAVADDSESGQDEGKSPGLSIGAIAGIAVGAGVCVIALVTVSLYRLCSRSRPTTVVKEFDSPATEVTYEMGKVAKTTSAV